MLDFDQGPMSLAQFVHGMRLERDMSVFELAEKCRITPEKVIAMETGKCLQPARYVLRNLADVLGVSYPYLLQLAGWL